VNVHVYETRNQRPAATFDNPVANRSFEIGRWSNGNNLRAPDQHRLVVVYSRLSSGKVDQSNMANENTAVRAAGGSRGRRRCGYHQQQTASEKTPKGPRTTE
jgi:hypothetical protein